MLSHALLSSLIILLTAAIPAALAQNQPLPYPHWKQLSDATWSLKGKAQQEQFEKALQAARASQQPDHYPQSEVLFEMGVAAFNSNQMGTAEQYFAQAAALKKEALDIMLTESKTGDRTEMYLPCYSNPADERAGKIHNLANCLAWLAKSQARQNHFPKASNTFDEALKTMRSNARAEMEIIILPDTLIEYAHTLRALNHPEQAQKLEEEARRLIKNRKLLLD